MGQLFYLAFEMHLAKKLKVKQGKISGPDDGINDILMEALFMKVLCRWVVLIRNWITI